VAAGTYLLADSTAWCRILAQIEEESLSSELVLCRSNETLRGHLCFLGLFIERHRRFKRSRAGLRSCIGYLRYWRGQGRLLDQIMDEVHIGAGRLVANSVLCT